jgi:protein-disulfide isomerase
VARANNRGGSNLKPFYILLGVIVLLGVSLMVYGQIRGGGSKASTEPVNLQTLDAQALLAKAKGVRVGPDSAPVQVMAFSDYMCPACAYFAATIEPQLLQEFVRTGQVQYIAYDFPLGGTHIHSFLAARAARCAEDQGKFWEYHKQLLTQQGTWSYSRVPPVDQFEEYAQQLGLNAETFGNCLNSDTHAELVTANYQLGQQAGVGGTPTVFVAGRQSLGPNDWDVLKAEILRALGQ